MIIYKVTNKVNGKIYIGQTKSSLEKRKQAHFQAAKEYKKKEKTQTKFYNAINKYEKENFIWEKIDKAENINCANKKEEFWIKYFDSYKAGYNTLKGGSNRELPEGVKKVISEKAKNRYKTEKGKIIRKIISENQKKRIKNKENIVCGRFGKEHMHHKKIKQYDTNGNFLNNFFGSFEAERKTKVNQSDIIKSCKMKTIASGGFFWIYESSREIEEKQIAEKINKNLIKNKMRGTNKSVKVTSLENGKELIFLSVKETARFLNFSDTFILNEFKKKGNTFINKNKNVRIELMPA